MMLYVFLLQYPVYTYMITMIMKFRHPRNYPSIKFKKNAYEKINLLISLYLSCMIYAVFDFYVIFNWISSHIVCLLRKNMKNIRNDTTPYIVNIDIPSWDVRALVKMKPSYFDWRNAKDILHNMANELLS